MDIQFNTGRSYSAAGQIIRAAQMPDRSVKFTDFTRAIAGHIQDVPPANSTATQFQTWIMNHYDRGAYTPTTPLEPIRV